MALQFTTADSASLASGVKVLVYSGAGYGKTVLTATLPTPVLISAESGTLSLKKANLERLFGVGNPHIAYHVPTIVIHTYEDFVDAYNWCLRSAEARAFQSIALDSISDMAEAVLNNAKRLVKDPRQAYGELIEKMETKVRDFRDLQGKHVYFAAKLSPFKDELSGTVKYGPSMPGQKLGPSLPYFFDEVFALRIGKDQQGNSYRFLQTQPDIQYEAKDRSGALAPVEHPHLGYLFSKILGATQ